MICVTAFGGVVVSVTASHCRVAEFESSQGCQDFSEMHKKLRTLRTATVFTGAELKRLVLSCVKLKGISNEPCMATVTENYEPKLSVNISLPNGWFSFFV